MTENIERKIGFSHGDLFKLHDVNTEKNILILAECSRDVIEINCHTGRDAESLKALLPYAQYFKRVSLHAPCDVRYGNNEKTRDLLRKLEDFYDKSGAALIVIHPDLVDDWSVFDNSKMAWAIENMDNRKKNFKNAADLKNFFDTHQKWSLVLDLGHCNSNDKTMLLAEELIELFQDRIKEIHLSGYEIFHDPLYRSKQKEIIAYCKRLSVPIVIESVFEKSDGVEGVKKELGYVVENLK